jgi:ubiquinone/menaquinone biosynthesis C-methylase UbiE
MPRPSRPDLPPVSESERLLRERIEANDPSVTAAEYDAFVLSRGRDLVACAVRDLLADVRRDIGIDALLEVAMGTGIITSRLRELPDLRQIGVDIRTDWLRYAVDNGRTSVADVVCADFEALPFGPGSFDAVTGAAFLNHRTGPALFYREARRVLRPDGTLLLPWVKPKPGSLEWEAALMTEAGFAVTRADAWYLLGRKA